MIVKILCWDFSENIHFEVHRATNSKKLGINNVCMHVCPSLRIVRGQTDGLDFQKSGMEVYVANNSNHFFYLVFTPIIGPESVKKNYKNAFY